MTARLRRVALYARVSTKDKHQDPELQLVPLREWAAHVYQADRVTEYVDHASSKDLRGRKRWRQLLHDVETGKVNVVAVWKLDRAFRSTLDASTTLESLRTNEVDFVSITQPIDTTTPTGRLVFAILAAVAEMERDLIVERVKEGMEHAKRKGSKIGRPSGSATPAFQRAWPSVSADVRAGRVSRSAAAKTLGVGVATLDRLLAAEAA
jgi:DNA invertase Pin-like site-specific DNA recombinase